jgi:hypothetical protein
MPPIVSRASPPPTGIGSLSYFVRSEVMRWTRLACPIQRCLTAFQPGEQEPAGQPAGSAVVDRRGADRCPVVVDPRVRTCRTLGASCRREPEGNCGVQCRHGYICDDPAAVPGPAPLSECISTKRVAYRVNLHREPRCRPTCRRPRSLSSAGRRSSCLSDRWSRIGQPSPPSAAAEAK